MSLNFALAFTVANCHIASSSRTTSFEVQSFKLTLDSSMNEVNEAGALVD